MLDIVAASAAKGLRLWRNTGRGHFVLASVPRGIVLRAIAADGSSAKSSGRSISRRRRTIATTPPCLAPPLRVRREALLPCSGRRSGFLPPSNVPLAPVALRRSPAAHAPCNVHCRPWSRGLVFGFVPEDTHACSVGGSARARRRGLERHRRRRLWLAAGAVFPRDAGDRRAEATDARRSERAARLSRRHPRAVRPRRRLVARGDARTRTSPSCSARSSTTGTRRRGPTRCGPAASASGSSA